MTPSRDLYLNGELVPYADARIHVQSTAIKYGRSVFEGLRAYWNPAHEELYVFRLKVGLAVDARPRKATQKPGITVGVSSWIRIADGAMPPRIKCSANYQNGRLAMLEARPAR